MAEGGAKPTINPREEFRNKAAAFVQQQALKAQVDHFNDQLEAQRMQAEAALRERTRALQARAKLADLQAQARAKVQAQAQAAQQGGEAPTMDLGFTQTNPGDASKAVNPTPFATLQGPDVSNVGQPGGPQPGPPGGQVGQGMATMPGGPPTTFSPAQVPPFLVQGTVRQGVEPVHTAPGVLYPFRTTQTQVGIRPNVMTAAEAAQIQAADQYHRAALAIQQGNADALERYRTQQLGLGAERNDIARQRAEAAMGASQARLDLARQKVRDTMLAPVATSVADPSLSPAERQARLDAAKANMSPEDAQRLDTLAQAASSKFAGTAYSAAKRAEWTANVKEANATYTAARETSDAIAAIRGSNIEQFGGWLNAAKRSGFNFGDAISPNLVSIFSGMTPEQRQQWMHDYGTFSSNLATLTSSKIRQQFPTGRAIQIEAKLLQGQLTNPTTNVNQLRGIIDELGRLGGYELVRAKLWNDDPARIGEPLDKITNRDVEQALATDAKALAGQGLKGPQIDAALEQKYQLGAGTMALMRSKWGQ